MPQIDYVLRNKLVDTSKEYTYKGNELQSSIYRPICEHELDGPKFTEDCIMCEVLSVYWIKQKLFFIVYRSDIYPAFKLVEVPKKKWKNSYQLVDLSAHTNYEMRIVFKSLDIFQKWNI